MTSEELNLFVTKIIKENKDYMIPSGCPDHVYCPKNFYDFIKNGGDAKEIKNMKPSKEVVIIRITN